VRIPASELNRGITLAECSSSRRTRCASQQLYLEEDTMRAVLLVCLLSASAFAQGAPDAPPPAATPPPNVVAAAPAPEAASTSGLRNGFSLSAGQEFGGDRMISGTMFGVDWRIGYRISEPLSIYLQSHLSFGSGHEASGASGTTGTFAAALMGEYLLPMGVFVGGGGGWGVLNNPNGPLAEARVGYYPMKATGAGKSRHLNVALDARFYFADQGYGTVNHIALSLGYDRF
jgi:hypothetical protein